MKFKFILFFIFIILTGLLFIQCPAQGSSGGGGGSGGDDERKNEVYSTLGLYDTTFNNGGSGADSIIYAITVQQDGKILIGGAFTTYNGLNVPDGIIRLNADGTYDSTFNSGVGNSGTDVAVLAIAVQSDGKILIGGAFTAYNGIDVPDGIMRLNADGSVDPGFNTGFVGTDADVYSLAVQSDGKILIGGGFTSYNGLNVPDGIIRLLSNGLFDTTFNGGNAGANNAISDIAVQSDGKILIGGGFITTYNGLNVPYGIIRLNTDGTYDTTFNSGGSGANANATIRAIAVQSDGKILIGGDFIYYNGINVPDGITRLNTDGTYDTIFNSSGNAGTNGAIVDLKVQSDGKILIGGGFTSYNGINRPDYIIRLNTDGLYDTTFNSGNTGLDNGVIAIAVQSDGKILIGGGFSTYNGVNVPDRIIRLY